MSKKVFFFFAVFGWYFTPWIRILSTAPYFPYLSVKEFLNYDPQNNMEHNDLVPIGPYLKRL